MSPPPSTVRPRTRLRFLAGSSVVATAVAAVALLASAPVAHGASATSPPPGHSWIRFGHFASGNGPVRVTIDGKTITSDAKFETVTPYDSVPAGRNTIAVVDRAEPSVHWSTTVDVSAGAAVTIAAVRETKGLRLHEWVDNLSAAPAGQAKVRLIDTATGESRLTVELDIAGAKTTAAVSGKAAAPTDPSIKDVTYGSASPYIDLAAGTYSVDIKNQAGKTVVSGHGWPVSAGTVASLVVVRSTAGPTLEVLRDAAGPTTTPTGAAQTGFGGMAHFTADTGASAVTGPLDAADLAGLGGILLVIGAGWYLTRRRRPLARGMAVTAVLASAAVVVVGCGTTPARPAAAPAVTSAPSAPSTTVVPKAAPSTTTTHPAVAANVNLAGSPTAAPAHWTSAPTAITIPSIDVHTSVIRLGRNADGTAQVPTTTNVVGWYASGPVPGQPGPAVILGHVDSYQGPGVFFDLKDIQPGAQVQVKEGARTVVFEVQSVSVYTKSHFPTASVYGPEPDRALRLVTCGGPFDEATGHYLDNVVAYATEVANRAS